MKKTVILAILAIMLAGCKKDNKELKIWDFINPDVVFVVSNAAGSNLLDPAVEGNILDRPIEVTYKGETYLMNGEAEGGTRASYVYWKGLRTEPLEDFSTGDHTPVLKFGEFAGDGDYHGEPFTVDWGDGTTTEVKFDLYVVYSDKYLTNATTYRKLWIDGELANDEDLVVRIVK